MTDVKVLNFMGHRRMLAMLSAILIFVSLGSLAFQGLNFGLDFTGGAQIEVGYEQPADVETIRNVLNGAGYRDVVVQFFGNNTDVLIRMQEDNNPQLGDQVLALLAETRSDVELRRNEFVGPQVGEELRENGGIGMLVALGLVMVYIALRFQFKFAVGAVAALAHDVVIVLGFFSITQMAFDLTVLAAILAVIGYSLNDTIVVADRIRENFRMVRRDETGYLINLSLTQTLSRTLITSLTTLLVLVTLGIVGGELIFGFSVALGVGVLVGTYSSVYVSANVLMALHLTKQDMMPPEKSDDPEEEDIPAWLTDADDDDSEDGKEKA
jgi:preprotein translocase subunit SecF